MKYVILALRIPGKFLTKIYGNNQEKMLAGVV